MNNIYEGLNDIVVARPFVISVSKYKNMASIISNITLEFVPSYVKGNSDGCTKHC